MNAGFDMEVTKAEAVTAILPITWGASRPHPHSDSAVCTDEIKLIFFFLVFLGLHSQHMEVSRLGVES